MPVLDVKIPVDGDIYLGARLYVPTGRGPFPAITMAHGYGGTFGHGLEKFAQKFVEKNFAVILHDHRGFGESEGEPRHDIDPWQQIKDWRRVITYLESREEVDEKRIGIWGTSYAGGHAIVLGATDRRLRCVVSQVPTISGYEQGLRRVNPDRTSDFDAMLARDERAQLKGQIGYQPLVSSDPYIAASYHDPEAVAFYQQPLTRSNWENKVTIRSTRLARMYEPGHWVSRVSPTPLLMLVAQQDKLTLTDLELAAYEDAHEPKKLVFIKGGHFAPYLDQFEVSSSEAIHWFIHNL
ncbi:TPA: alpha/beta hydrolase [Serratia marcescens]